jgi:hypothetical protein
MLIYAVVWSFEGVEIQEALRGTPMWEKSPRP